MESSTDHVNILNPRAHHNFHVFKLPYRAYRLCSKRLLLDYYNRVYIDFVPCHFS